MKILGNIIWLILGGFAIFLEYLVGSLALMVTIIGIPFGIQTLKLAMLAVWPFGRDTRSQARASGCLYILMNIIWLIFGGIWIALTHVFLGFILFITIVGIPWGMQHFKLAAVALTPFGRDIIYTG